MELNDFEKLWKENDKRLEKSLTINEKIIFKLKAQAIGEFSKLLNLHKLGRNLALVYFIISMILSGIMLNDFKYSVPGIVGGLLMLWSFFYHLSTTEKAPESEFYNLPVMDLQKRINGFKIRSLHVGKYDYIVVAIWYLTIIPLCLIIFFNIDIHSSSRTSLLFFLISGTLIAILFPLSKLYIKSIVGDKLDNAEHNLDMIREFENEDLK